MSDAMLGAWNAMDGSIQMPKEACVIQHRRYYWWKQRFLPALARPLLRNEEPQEEIDPDPAKAEHEKRNSNQQRVSVEVFRQSATYPGKSSIRLATMKLS